MEELLPCPQVCTAKRARTEAGLSLFFMYAMIGFYETHSAFNGLVIIIQTHSSHHLLPSVKVSNTLYDRLYT